LSPRATPHCGPEDKRALVVTARLAPEAARSDLEAAVDTYELIGGSRHDYAMAKLALADDDLERYLSLRFPDQMSAQRFDAWVRVKSHLAEEVQARYNEIFTLGDAEASIVAASRTGTITSAFADELETAEIPVDVRSGEAAEDKIDAYCDALTTAAEPVERPAEAAFTACVTAARDHAYDLTFRDIAAVAKPCRDALAATHPERFPPLDEVFVASELERMRMQLDVVDDDVVGDGYDQLNTHGVASRIRGDFAQAHAAYDRAIALDPARPEAHYNLGLLEMFEGTRGEDLGIDHDERAVADFTRAAERATGTLHDDALAHAADAQKVIRQLRAFQAQSE
jgi:tetratricopeptide (TPR) repeat protein